MRAFMIIMKPFYQDADACSSRCVQRGGTVSDGRYYAAL